MQWEKPGKRGQERSFDVPGQTHHHPAVSGSGDLVVNDQPNGPHMSLPISHEEAGILRGLPHPAREEFKRHIHERIGQMGKEHGRGGLSSK